jgi:hypothetical protein
MRTRLTLLVTAAAVLVPAAGAEAKTIKSTVEVLGSSAGSGTVAANGDIESPRDRCLSKRVIRITAFVGEERVRLRTDVSSRNGYWGGDGAATDFPDEIRARMKPKRLSKRARCAGDTDSSLNMRAQPRTTFPGEIQYVTLAYAGGEVGGSGNIVSVRRCLAGRKLKVFDFDDGVRGKRVRASDVSSRNGYWGAFGPSDSEGVNLTLVKKRLGAGNRCAGKSYSYDPDPN